MIEDAEKWYEIFIQIFARPGLGAVLVGLVTGFIIPQRAKMDFPVEWPDAKRKRMTRTVSFFSGFIGTMLFWPVFWSWKDAGAIEQYGIWVGGFITAIIVGASAPMVYAVVMNQMYKRGLIKEEVWSGEARAKIKRTGVGPK